MYIQRIMKPETIFGPVGALAMWTAVVVLLIGFRRLRAVRAGVLSASDFRLGESADVPADVAVVNRNYMNLLEMPVLFYVVSLAFYVTHHVNRPVVILAWSYVGLRLVHSLIHVTTNHVRRRLIAFALSNVVLLTMWIRFLRGLF
jgi:hypothetical protein